LNKKLHILFLCGWYPSRILPNNGDFIQRHAQAVSLKHKVTAVHIISDKNATETIEIDSKIIDGIQTHIAYIKHFKNPLQKGFIFLKAYRLLLAKVDTFDIIHLNEIFPFGILSLYSKWFQKKPFIISEHFTGYLESSNFKVPFFQKLISKYIVKKAGAVCTVSDNLTKDMKNAGYVGNFITVPNVVDTDLFLPKKKTFSFLKLIHISSLKDDHKNITGMLNVAKLLDDKLDYFEWDFIGNDGDEYSEYLTKLDIKKGKISFLEHQNHSEIVSHLQNVTICISFSNYETFGIVIPEAIACGTPVITTKTGIALSFSDVNYCKIIPIKNEKLLLDAILNHETLFANLDANKMHSIIKEQFSKDVISQKFSKCYNKTLKK
jgi:glycosyltransferase involved in cell wall biosynthesis